ncbi:CU044_2847 family protein [Streptomyces sp. B-S-A8]|uniref:CU044_2847 family protein n=1 Tax=Streptomyces solicavernae TaxID=3043614 RepID=A0ABT6RNL5_9ACTN|nr:CU044_2847 family protein [Streptomyces sp. B-S-A8]MDI3385960.1 CU044_2847 family protein [Streptomyces sp. B-S-A8]
MADSMWTDEAAGEPDRSRGEAGEAPGVIPGDALPQGVWPITLPGGAGRIMARVTPTDQYEDQDIGVLDTAGARLEQLGELIQGVGTSVLDAARAVRPDEAAITFGVELSTKSGRAFAILAEGEAKASVQVTLTWRLGDGDA